MLQRQQPESKVDACCSFCGKQHQQVERLTAGPGGVYICNECVDLCRKIIEERGSIDLLTPSRILCKDFPPLRKRLKR